MAETKKINATVDLVKSGVEFKLNGGTILSDDGTSHYLHSQSNLYLYSGSSNTMTLSAAGNVGIGTTSPTKKLHVVGGSTYAALLDSDQDYTLGLSRSGTEEWWLKTYTDGRFAIHENGVGDKVTIKAGGNVGIGTTNPVGKFHSYISANRQIGHNAVGGDLGVISDNNSAPVLYVKGTGTADLVNIFDDTTEVFTILDGGNVGIGTTSPGAKLDVTTNHQAQTAIRVTHNNYNDYVLLKRRSDDTQKLGIKEENSNGSMGLFTADTTRVTITSAGNVGIGTTSPSSKLDIDGGNTGNSLFVNGYVSGSAYGISDRFVLKSATRLWFYDSNTQIYRSGTALKMYGDDGVIFETNSNERMRIHSNGNISVGTTNAYARFSVKATSHNNGISVNRQADTTAAIYIGNNGGNNPVLAANNADMLFGRDVSGTFTERMRLTNGGNLGIGTTSPGVKLHVNSGSVRAEGNATDQFFFEGVRTGVGTTIRIYDNANTAYIDSYNNMAFRANQNGGSGGSFRFTGGNVGIGTTSPAAKLNVSTSSLWGTAVTDAITIDNTGSAGDVNSEHSLGRIRWRTNGVIGASIDAIRDTPGAGHNVDIAFSTNTGGSGTSTVERMRINYNGNVGIGTTSPSNTLDVNGGAEINGETYIRSTSNVGLRIQTTDQGIGGNDGLRVGLNATHAFVWQYENKPLAFATNGGQRMTISAGGNVGIGTTSPTLGLHVANGLGALFGPSGSGASTYISADDENTINGGYGLDTDTADLWVNYRGYQNGTSRFRDFRVGNGKTGVVAFFDGSSGNVGIGTTSPKAALDVKGRFVVDSKTMTITNLFDDALTVVMSNHSGCYVKITAFGDWGGHSSISYLGEFFLNNGAGSYNEPGMIIRQEDNTYNDAIQAQIVDPGGTSGDREFIIQLKATAIASFTAYITYTIQGMFVSAS